MTLHKKRLIPPTVRRAAEKQREMDESWARTRAGMPMIWVSHPHSHHNFLSPSLSLILQFYMNTYYDRYSSTI